MNEQQIKIQKPAQLNPKDSKSQWIENEEYCIQSSTKPSNEFEEDFKMQHQQYLILKNKRKQEALRKKIEQFGQSSSDEEIQQKKTSLKSFLNEHTDQSPTKKEEKRLQKSYENSFQKDNSPSKKEKGLKFGSQKSAPSNKIQILLSGKKGTDNWIKEEVSINQKIIAFSSLSYPFYDLSKMKLIFNEVGESCYKIKITCKNQQAIFAASHKTKAFELPTVYFIFSKIIKSRLNLMGRKISSFVISKNNGLPEAIVKNSFISGKIMKKSRMISRWSEIFAYIDEKGLYYQKKLNQKGELLVERGSISELWTRFEFQDEFFIVKLFENGHKIELGIPLQDFTNINSWLYHLYGLVFKKV